MLNTQKRGREFSEAWNLKETPKAEGQIEREPLL